MTVARRVILAVMVLGSVAVAVAGVWLHLQGSPFLGLLVAATGALNVAAAYLHFGEGDLFLGLLIGSTGLLVLLSARPYLGLG